MKHFFTLALMSTLANAEVISVNFERGTTSSGDELAANDSAGVESSTNWNNINVGDIGSRVTTIAATTLNNHTGAATTATVAINLDKAYIGNSESGTSTTDHSMMSGYISWDPVDGTTPDDSGTITIDNLPASITAGYKVYVYFDSNENNRSFDVTIGGTTISGADSSTFSGTFNNATETPDDANYAEITGLTASTFTIAMNADTGRAAINGFQIVSDDHTPPATEVPTIESFTLNDHYVPSGTAVTLSWQTTDATTITINQSIGDVTGISSDGDGNTSTSATAATTYTLTATNEAGSSNADLTLKIGPERPNIVLFLVDDMGAHDTSEPFQVDSNGDDVPSALNSRYITPSMEALAAAGMKFTRAYAMPVCTPTRCSLMTGNNSATHGVTNWTHANTTGAETGQNSTSSHNSPLNWRRIGLDTTGETLPKILSTAGYRSIHAGKGHFGNDTSNENPTLVGFDINIGGDSFGAPGSYTGDYGKGGSKAIPGLDAYHDTGTFLTEALTLEINKAIEQSVDDGVPFFAYMSHYAVHSPYEKDPRFEANYPELSGSSLKFATMVEGMDKSLGDMVAKVNSLGVGENTLVIFMSDNGSTMSDSTPLRGKKGHKYEGGTRVPMIVGWATPNGSNNFQTDLNIPVDSYQDDIVSCFDIFPTILSVADVSNPSSVDGYDLSEYFKGTAGNHRPQELMIHFPHDHNNAAGDYYTVLHQDQYKLIYSFASDSYELYDVVDDISEGSDLAAEQPERVMAMARKMAVQLNSHSALWPTFNADDSDDPFAMPTIAGVDLDNDSIDDNAEDLNGNGLLDAGETNPENDNSDGDNINDGDEAKLGTDPLDASSSFTLTPVSQSDGSIILSWPSSPGSTFTILSSTDLNDWDTILASNIAANGVTNSTSYTLPNPSGDKQFYRAELE